MPSAFINDVPLYYEVHGRGEPLVLAAGLGSDSLSWEPILKELARHFTVVVFDNRGTGRTPLSEAQITIERMTDDCVALARHLGLSSFNLLGHSMGGYIAIDCALRYPQAVDGLILAATSSRTSKRNRALFTDWADCFEAGQDPELWFRNIFYWVFSPEFFENEIALKGAIRFELEYPYPINPATFRQQVAAIAGFNRREAVTGIKARTLVMAAKGDLLIPPEESLRLAQAIPGAAFSLIEHTAHSLFTENPRDSVEAVVRFLSEGKPGVATTPK